MLQRNTLWVGIMIIIAGALSIATAEVPQMINYQGRLVDGGGQPVTTPVNVVFAIWNAETDGDSLWSEEQTITPDANGAFITLLGSVSPIPDSAFTGDAFLSTKVESDPEMSPRSQLVSVAFSYRVGTIQGASGGEISDQLILPDPGGDTLILEPQGIVIRGAGGDENVECASSGITVTDPTGDVRITISIDGDGPAITMYESTAGLHKDGQGTGNPKIEFREGGVTIYGSGVTDTVCQLLPNGNIYGRGQITMGDVHSASGEWANVVGYSNEASGDSSVVCGGWGNTASGPSSAVVGGHSNTASGYESFVGGGWANMASATRSTIVGGDGNTVSQEGSFIGGGNENTITGAENAIGGGLRNSAGSESQITIGGGRENIATGAWSTIGGGWENVASGMYGTVAGGRSDTAYGEASFVGGGRSNAAGSYSVVPGGRYNRAHGAYSLAAGRRAKAIHGGNFVWADRSDFDFSSSAADEFAARCVGGVRFVTGIDGSGVPNAGVQVAAGGGSWSSISDRNLKENLSPVDAAEVLEKLASLPISTWNYKAQNESIRHMGPMAQDIYAAFGVGESDRYITTVDADGIALVAIQALHKKTQELDEQAKEIERLKAQMAELQTLVRKLMEEH